MCSTTINLTTKALNDVTNAEVLLKIKGIVALFIQTMEVCFSFRYYRIWTPYSFSFTLGIWIPRFQPGNFYAQIV